jgi:hypothetical protein
MAQFGKRKLQQRQGATSFSQGTVNAADNSVVKKKASLITTAVKAAKKSAIATKAKRDIAKGEKAKASNKSTAAGATTKTRKEGQKKGTVDKPATALKSRVNRKKQTRKNSKSKTPKPVVTAGKAGVRRRKAKAEPRAGSYNSQRKLEEQKVAKQLKAKKKK